MESPSHILAARNSGASSPLRMRRSRLFAPPDLDTDLIGLARSGIDQSLIAI